MSENDTIVETIDVSTIISKQDTIECENEGLIVDKDGNTILNENVDLSESEDVDLDAFVEDASDLTSHGALVEFEKDEPKNTYAYDADCLMPGEGAKFDDKLLKEVDNATMRHAGEMSLLANMATKKLKAEEARKRAMSDEARIHEYVVDTACKSQQNEYFTKNGFEMTGRQKRTLRKAMENSYAKKKFRITKKQRQDIIDYLNLSSSNASNDKEKNSKVDGTTKGVAAQVEALLKHKV